MRHARIQDADECRVFGNTAPTFDLHTAFCILHSAFQRHLQHLRARIQGQNPGFLSLHSAFGIPQASLLARKSALPGRFRTLDSGFAFWILQSRRQPVRRNHRRALQRRRGNRPLKHSCHWHQSCGADHGLSSSSVEWYARSRWFECVCCSFTTLLSLPPPPSPPSLVLAAAARSLCSHRFSTDACGSAPLLLQLVPPSVPPSCCYCTAVWDECTMLSKEVLEVIDRHLRDLMGNDLLFGGKREVRAAAVC